jgi:uncharacterized protein
MRGAAVVDVKVNELLANIRKSVDTDIDSLSSGTPVQSRGTLMRGALREMRVSMNAETEAPSPIRADISDLRSRIRQKMDAIELERLATASQVYETPKPVAPVVAARADFSEILSRPSLRAGSPGLRGSFASAPSQDDLRYAPQPEPQYWEAEARPYAEQDPFPQHDPYAHGYREQGYAPDYPPQLEAPIMSAQTEAQAETAFRQLSDAILSRATGDRSLEEMTREMLRTMLKQWLDANLPAIVEDMVREEIQRVARRGR